MTGASGAGEEEYRERVMRAVAFMEANLGSPLSLSDAAREAAWSFFHFHRLFQSFIGMAPGEYLRKRRLAEAARLIARAEGGLEEVARATGFGSAQSLCRSFKADFGLTPGEYRKRASTLALMNPFAPNERPVLRPSPCLSGEPRVEEYGPVHLVAASRRFVLDDGRLLPRIADFWEASMPALEAAAGRPAGSGLLESWELAEGDQADGGKAIRLHVGVRKPPGARTRPAGLADHFIPRGRYLLALHRGPASLLNGTYLYLYGSWLPRRGLCPGAAMDFAYYGEGFDRGDPESATSIVEFRIPLA
jgi:AraC family transcriptional regulator